MPQFFPCMLSTEALCLHACRRRTSVVHGALLSSAISFVRILTWSPCDNQHLRAPPPSSDLHYNLTSLIATLTFLNLSLEPLMIRFSSASSPCPWQSNQGLRLSLPLWSLHRPLQKHDFPSPISALKPFLFKWPSSMHPNPPYSSKCSLIYPPCGLRPDLHPMTGFPMLSLTFS